VVGALGYVRLAEPKALFTVRLYLGRVWRMSHRMAFSAQGLAVLATAVLAAAPLR
jgi:hypothetical protein